MGVCGGRHVRYYWYGCCLGLTLLALRVDSNEVGGRKVKVGSSLELWEAFHDQGITAIQITRNIELERDLWPGDDGDAGLRDFVIPLGRNLTIEKDPEMEGRPVLDVDFMRFRVGVDAGMRLVLRGLVFKRCARDPDEQLALDFFALSLKSTLVYEDIVAEVAVDLQRTKSSLNFLKNLPRPLYPPELQWTRQAVKLMYGPTVRCIELSGQKCPSGALWLKDFGNVVHITDKRTLNAWFVTIIARNSLFKVVDVAKGWPKSREEASGHKTMVAQSFSDLKIALHDPQVAIVYLWRDLVFGMSSWPNWEGRHVETSTLKRNLTITTHPITQRKSGKAKLDFNYAQGALVVKHKSTVTLKGLSLDRLSKTTADTGILPFFAMHHGSKIVVENGDLHIPVTMNELTSLESGSVGLFADRIQVSGKEHGGISTLPNGCLDVGNGVCDVVASVDDAVLKQITVSGEKMKEHNYRRMALKSLPGHDQVLINLRQSRLVCFNAKHLPLQDERMIFETSGIVSVLTEQDFREALMSRAVSGVFLTNSLNISEEVWPQDSPVDLNRDFSITTHPHSPVAMSVDLNFLFARVNVGGGHSLALEWMNFTRVSNNGESLHYIPFFSWQDNSTIGIKDVLSQMAVEPLRTGPLDDRYSRNFKAIPGPSWFEDPYANYTQVQIYDTGMCKELLKIPCVNGALHIHRGVQQVSLRDTVPKNASRRGSGVFIATNMLLLADDLEETTLMTREEEAAAVGKLNVLNAAASGVQIAEKNGPLHRISPAYVALASVFLIVVILGLVACRYKYERGRQMCRREKSTYHDARVTKDHHEVAAELLGDVTLGPLMGVGGFARVYRATWNGSPVAVKVILHKGGALEASIVSEALLSTMLRHPHIVQGYHYATRTVNNDADDSTEDAAQNKAEGDPIPQGTDPEKSKGVEDAEDEKSSNRSFVLQSYTDNQTSIVSHKKFMSSAGSSTISSVANTSVLMSDSSTGSPKSFSQTPALYRETWLVQEFCDLGCLSDSLQTGLFMNTREGRPHMVHILMTAQDIARGMTYLHDDNVIHGDLKGSNVLLQRRATDPRGYVAKVADFGLSRQMITDRTHMSTTSFGTVTHMPPEVLMQGRLSLPADVYSFGVILWEMIAGDAPFRNMMQMEVMRKVVLEKKRPEIPGLTPDDYRNLIEQCWCHEPHNRLTFRVILERLDEMLSCLDLEPPVG